ncbi:hypothetical protein DSM104440_00343 [Usitatibacter palustris]|uniref:Uncharacterized protein n=1 Tax=Usitatibacter palustris TaxID=2732487 RepID=A0A6M4H207_9PROT|nr:hypothetical protein DSM104440_00343 [Usitatibacter palustris]
MARMNLRMFGALLIPALIVFAVGFAWWWDFLQMDQCLDRGGSFEDGVCDGATVELSLWGGAWHLWVFVLVPPLVGTCTLMFMAWLGILISSSGGRNA